MFQIDFSSRTPIYQQLINNIIQLIATNALKPDDKLPPVRTLAVDLGINPNTISKAYKILEQEGYIYSNVGRGSFISSKLSSESVEKQIALEEFEKSIHKAVSMGASKEELIEIIDSAL